MVHTSGNSFYVSLATLPGRETVVWRAVKSLLEQERPPEATLVCAPRAFSRLPNRTVAYDWLMRAAPRGMPGQIKLAHPKVDWRWCDHDAGPATKLLCAIPWVSHKLARSLLPGSTQSWLVLCDDDRAYKPWAFGDLDLHLARNALRESTPSSAYSFGTWEVLK